jgi:lysophospholipase L1-like esterase
MRKAEIGSVLALASLIACSNPTQPGGGTGGGPPGPPTITCPAAPAPVTSASGQGVSVVYGTAIATPSNAAVSCAPPSGSTFPVGTTAIVCTATDSTQRTASCTFNVVVQRSPLISLTNYVAFGDSITWGEDGQPSVSCAPTTTSTLETLSRIRPLFQYPDAQQYPTVLRSLLASRYVAQAAIIAVANRGKPGERAGSPDTLVRFNSVLTGSSYQAVLLMEGTNDIFSGDSTQIPIAIAGLRTMIRSAKQRNVRPFLATVPPMVQGGARACGYQLVPQLNLAIATLASQESVTLVDVYGGFGTSYAQYFGADGLHPNDQGYAKIADIFFNALRQALELPQVGTTSLAVPTAVFPRLRSRPPQ